MINWNADYVKTVSKAEWMDQHKHHADEADLSAEYDKLVPPPTPKKEVEEIKES